MMVSSYIFSLLSNWSDSNLHSLGPDSMMDHYPIMASFSITHVFVLKPPWLFDLIFLVDAIVLDAFLLLV